MTVAFPSYSAFLGGMSLVNHGGKCCGIKSVYNMYTDPMQEHGALEAIPFNDNDACGRNVTSNMRFFHEAAPKETGVDRLKRYIAYMEQYRPLNMLEVVLAQSPYDYCCQLIKWEPVLLELGFKKVFSHNNSNSGNICHVFYLAIGEPKPLGTMTEEDNDEDGPCECDDCRAERDPW